MYVLVGATAADLVLVIYKSASFRKPVQLVSHFLNITRIRPLPLASDLILEILNHIVVGVPNFIRLPRSLVACLGISLSRSADRCSC